jgi:hypothetical protein
VAASARAASPKLWVHADDADSEARAAGDQQDKDDRGGLGVPGQAVRGHQDSEGRTN